MESQQDTPAVESCLSESPASAHKIESTDGFWYHPDTDTLHLKRNWSNQEGMTGSNRKGTHSDAALTDLNIPTLAGYKNTGPDDFYVLEMTMIQGWVRGVNFDGNIILQGINEESAVKAFHALAPYFDTNHVIQVSLVGWIDDYERVIRAIDIEDFTGDE